MKENFIFGNIFTELLIFLRSFSGYLTKTFFKYILTIFNEIVLLPKYEVR